MSNLRFDRELSQSPSPEFLYISFSRYEKDWVSILHSHSNAELMYITKGYGELIMLDQSYELKPNSFVLIPPHKMHTEQSSAKEPLEYYVLGVANIDFKTDDEETFCPILEADANTEELKTLFIGIYREMQMKKVSYRMMINSYILRIAVILTRRKKINVGLEESMDLRPDLAIVKSYIEANYADKISLEKLAEISNMSKFHLVREFSKALGSTPMDYLQCRRVDIAKTLLSSTGMSISEVASSVGYSSSSYFTQRFKLTQGITPMAFRSGSEIHP